MNGEKIDPSVVKIRYVEKLVKATRQRAHKRKKKANKEAAEAAEAAEALITLKEKHEEVLRKELNMLEKALTRIVKNKESKQWLKKHGLKVRETTCKCYSFNIGRTLAQKGFKRLSEKYYRPFTVNGERRLVYMRDPLEGTKPEWMKRLYKDHLLPVAKLIDKEWVGENHDVVFQINIMDSPKMHVKEHIDSNDVSFQYAIGLGEYTDGEFFTTNNGKRVELLLKNCIVKLDGGLPHGSNKILSGTRFTIFVYKLYD